MASKQRSRLGILDAASKRIRGEGLEGAAIATVMADSGLTHGAFYVHFPDKNALIRAAIVHALRDSRAAWIGERRVEGWSRRLARLARGYLTPWHRDNPSRGCAFAALGSEAARSNAAFKETFEGEVLKSLSAICDGDVTGVPSSRSDQAQFDQAQFDQAQFDQALAFLSLMVGGLTLARAVQSEDLSDRLLAACIKVAETLAEKGAP